MPPALRTKTHSTSLNRRRRAVAKPDSIWTTFKRVDRTFLFLTLGLCLFGIVMVYNASVVLAYRHFDDKYYFVSHQVIWLLLGLAAMAVTLHLPVHWWQRNARKLLYLTLILLVFALISQKTLGARRWVNIGGFSLQPSEIAKIALPAFLSTIFIKSQEPYKEFLRITGLVLSLIMLQPDLGTTVVLAVSSLIIYWVAGAPLKHFLAIGAAGIGGVLVLILTSSYRMRRLMTFLNADQDPLGMSYHVRQILLSLGSGGLWGVGIGQSRQKYAYLPEVTTDSIFAIIAEELGYIGASILILLITLLILRGFKIAARAVDPYARLLASGLMAWIGFQAYVNIAAMVILVPLTGIPLPLISYGGSSLVITLASMGIILNISSQSQINHSRKIHQKS